MGWREFKTRFRGREFWRSLNKILFIGIYTLLFIMTFLFRQYIIHIIIGLAVLVPTYGWFYTNHLREMEKRRKSHKVVQGWITHGYKIGERCHFYPTSFEIQTKLSPENLKETLDFIDKLKLEVKDYQKKKIGLEKVIYLRQQQQQQQQQQLPDKREEQKQIEDNKEEFLRKIGYYDDQTKKKEGVEENEHT